PHDRTRGLRAASILLTDADMTFSGLQLRRRPQHPYPCWAGIRAQRHLKATLPHRASWRSLANVRAETASGNRQYRLPSVRTILSKGHLPGLRARSAMEVEFLSLSRRSSMREPAEPFSILLVEDDRATADMYAIALRLDGCTVQIAGDGWCGLREAQQHAPHLLLLDVHLPGLDGHSVLSVLRQYGDTWSPPAIMLSNETSPHGLRRRTELGAVAHL